MHSRAGCTALWLWLLLLLALRCSRAGGLSQESAGLAAGSAEPSLSLAQVLETEIAAAKQQLQLYKRKAGLIKDAIEQLERVAEDSRVDDASGSQQKSPPRRTQRKHSTPQLFDDWLDCHGSLPLPVEGDDTNTSRPLARLISFRSNGKPSDNRNAGLLQFLLVLDPHSTMLSLYHPMSHELLWQHTLQLWRRSAQEAEWAITDMFFVSESNTHLAILSAAGEVALFKLRLWHNRRVISGPQRRLVPMRDLHVAQLQCVAGHGNLDSPAESPLAFLSHTAPALTTPVSGNYFHLDVEHLFRTTLPGKWSYEGGKVAVVALYHRVYVAVSDASGEFLSFFHGRNGSVAGELRLQTHEKSSEAGTVVQLEPMRTSGGILALATKTRVHFVDAVNVLLLPGTCEAPQGHPLASVAIDPLRSSVVYAGTSTGRAFVFRLHNFRLWREYTRKKEEGDVSNDEVYKPAMCTLEDQLAPRRPQVPVPSSLVTGSPATVRTMPGFLVLATGVRIALYQLSTRSEVLRPTYLSERSLLTSPVEELDAILSPDEQGVQILGLSVATDVVAHSVALVVLVATSEGQQVVDGSTKRVVHRLDVYSSRLPPPTTSLDLGWMRLPAMMICALAVMFWQQKTAAARGPGIEDMELSGLVELLGKRGVHMPSLARKK